MAIPVSLSTSIHYTPYLVKKIVTDRLTRDLWSFSEYGDGTVEEYLREVIGWILTAQQSCNGQGIPSYFKPYKGFSYPYPETSGYIITSLLDACAYLNDDSLKTAAISIADWLLKRQLSSGAMRCNLEAPGVHFDRENGSDVVFFDMGMILEGLVNLWKEISDDRYRDAAIRLADYLVSTQAEDGLWHKDLHFSYFGTHNTRAVWVLIRAGKILDKPEYIDSGVRCLHALKKNVRSNIFMTGCQFSDHGKTDIAFTHALAYAIEGFLKSGLELESEEFIEIGVNAGYKLQRIAEIRKQMFFSHYYRNWKPATRYQCVTGNVQIAMIWLEITKYNGDLTLASSAMKFQELVRTLIIDIKTKLPGVRGGLPGSFPIYGGYATCMYPNWGAKFFIDASLLELELAKKVQHEN